MLHSSLTHNWCIESLSPFFPPLSNLKDGLLCSLDSPYGWSTKDKHPISPRPQMMYVPECVRLLSIISGTHFRYCALPAINLKMTDWSSLIILIGPFLVSKNWDPILPGGTKKWAPTFLHKNVTFTHLCSSFAAGDQFHNQWWGKTRARKERLPVGAVILHCIDRASLLLICPSSACFYKTTLSASYLFSGIYMHSFKMHPKPMDFNKDSDCVTRTLIKEHTCQSPSPPNDPCSASRHDSPRRTTNWSVMP